MIAGGALSLELLSPRGAGTDEELRAEFDMKRMRRKKERTANEGEVMRVRNLTRTVMSNE